ncbi:MAG: hypothetical protein K2Z81_05455, partial [Cyanobacteria bacterium]|nr:hypothetical protein [Cyanobacteriota bacterium]
TVYSNLFTIPDSNMLAYLDACPAETDSAIRRNLSHSCASPLDIRTIYGSIISRHMRRTAGGRRARKSINFGLR